MQGQEMGRGRTRLGVQREDHVVPVDVAQELLPEVASPLRTIPRARPAWCPTALGDAQRWPLHSLAGSVTGEEVAIEHADRHEGGDTHDASDCRPSHKPQRPRSSSASVLSSGRTTRAPRSATLPRASWACITASSLWWLYGRERRRWLYRGKCHFCARFVFYVGQWHQRLAFFHQRTESDATALHGCPDQQRRTTCELRRTSSCPTS